MFTRRRFLALLGIAPAAVAPPDRVTPVNLSEVFDGEFYAKRGLVVEEFYAVPAMWLEDHLLGPGPPELYGLSARGIQ